jgi:hypothetical protein
MKALLTLTGILSAITIAAPAALADGFITDTLGGNGHAVPSYRFITDTLGGSGSPKAVPDAVERYVATHAAQPQVQGMQFTTDTLAPGGGQPLAAAPSSTGFSWADAGVGAGGVVGTLIVLAAGLLFVRRRDAILA